MAERINWFDMLTYRLFYWRWSRLLAEDAELNALFRKWVNGYAKEREINRWVLEHRVTTTEHRDE